MFGGTVVVKFDAVAAADITRGSNDKTIVPAIAIFFSNFIFGKQILTFFDLFLTDLIIAKLM